MASRASNWAGVVDVVPGMNNLTLVFGPLADAQRLTTQLREAWEESQALVADGKLVDIEQPVTTEELFGLCLVGHYQEGTSP